MPENLVISLQVRALTGVLVQYPLQKELERWYNKAETVGVRILAVIDDGTVDICISKICILRRIIKKRI